MNPKYLTILTLCGLGTISFSFGQQGSSLDLLIQLAQSLPVAPTPPHNLIDHVEEVPAERIHTIRSGDNAWDLARRYGVSIESLIALNGVEKTRTPQVGQVLRVPKGKVLERKVGGSVDSNGIYIVAKGDNPWTIARKLKVDRKKLLEVNGITNPRSLQIGQKLRLPSQG